MRRQRIIPRMRALTQQEILDEWNDCRAGHAHLHMKTLHLTLKRQWFDEIAAGTKREEFRDQSPHWLRILGPHVGKPPWTEIHFRNGYSPSSPFMRVVCTGLRVGKYASGIPCYILSLGAVLEIKR